METRNIYRGSEFLGECTLDQARTLLFQGHLRHSDDDDAPRIGTSAATIQGYSGGPLLSRYGEVIGMAVTHSTNGIIPSRRVPLHELRNLAERVAFMQRVRESE